MSVESQQCELCGRDLPLSDFYKRKDSGKYRPNCKRCHQLKHAAWRYNVSVEDILSLRKEQENCCAICGHHADEIVAAVNKFESLYVDHDHKTGRVRGLLCHRCNFGIGHFLDEPERLMAAAKYLLTRSTL